MARFTLSPKNLDTPVVSDGITWEGQLWEIEDHHHELVFWFHTEEEAREALAFIHQYVQRHGNISFMAFPNSLDEPFVPALLARIDSSGAKQDLAEHDSQSVEG